MGPDWPGLALFIVEKVQRELVEARAEEYRATTTAASVPSVEKEVCDENTVVSEIVEDDSL